VNESTVRRVQEVLIADGQLPANSADGQFGALTAQAIEAWQADANLTVNGLPDMVTLFLMAQKITE
jgi:peptidoglycan hydrolase-like protein with peptidoglycan-binding domain